ncbi:MAG: hypothetical protein ACKPKO_07735 [Candidatus Fonsibacter sp.]
MMNYLLILNTSLTSYVLIDFLVQLYYYKRDTRFFHFSVSVSILYFHVFFLGLIVQYFLYTFLSSFPHVSFATFC